MQFALHIRQPLCVGEYPGPAHLASLCVCFSVYSCIALVLCHFSAVCGPGVNWLSVSFSILRLELWFAGRITQDHCAVPHWQGSLFPSPVSSGDQTQNAHWEAVGGRAGWGL